MDGRVLAGILAEAVFAVWAGPVAQQKLLVRLCTFHLPLFKFNVQIDKLLGLGLYLSLFRNNWCVVELLNGLIQISES